MIKEERNRSAFNYNSVVHSTLVSICEPLFSNFNIKHFRYMRLFNDCRYLSLGTNLEYMRYYLEKLKNPGKIFINPLIGVEEKRFSYFLWPNNLPKNEEDPLLNYLYDSDIWNGCSIYKKQENYIDIWTFTSTKDNSLMHQFYINNVHLLEYFIAYFESRAAKLIGDLSPDKLAMFHCPFNLSDLATDTPVRNNISKFLNETKIIKFAITVADKKIYLTQRELQCLLYISTGKTLKSIGELLNISVRTVESHLDSIKEKTGTHFKSNLTNILSIDELISLKYELLKKTL